MGLFLSCGCVDTTVWMHHIEANKTHREKLDGDWARKLRTVLNKYWMQHPVKHQLYGHLCPIS